MTIITFQLLERWKIQIKSTRATSLREIRFTAQFLIEKSTFNMIP